MISYWRYLVFSFLFFFEVKLAVLDFDPGRTLLSNQVNASRQFVGVAEMLGPVDFKKDMKFWKLDKYNGFFPIKWHIIKDVPNNKFVHIILQNNDNRPVTFSRDTQEVNLTFEHYSSSFLFNFL